MTELADLLVPERVRLEVDAERRQDVLKALAELVGGQDSTVREAVFDDLVSREHMGSTGVGNGIAFPHARVDFLPSLRLACVRTTTPVEFSALDGRPVDLFFALAGSKQARREYLAALGSLSYLFRNDETRRRFREAPDGAEVVRLFRELVASTPRVG